MNDGLAVLIVDDDEDIRDIGALALESNGYRVATAKDGLDAMETLKRNGIGVILLDLMMPRMDGEQFLRALRAGANARIPVIIMTGDTTALEVARELSADALVQKPVDVDVLLKTIRSLIG